MFKRFFQSLLFYLVKGVLVVVPVAGSIFLIVWLVASIDNALNLTNYLDSESRQIYYVPGMGIFMVLILLIIVGFIFTKLVTSPIQHWLNRIIGRIPIFKTIYSSIKDFTEAFVGDAKKFNEPVLVLVNETGLKKIGFLTQKDLKTMGLEGEVMVYFPYSYSFAGQVVVVPAQNVKPLNLTSAQAMKLVLSGGVTSLE